MTRELSVDVELLEKVSNVYMYEVAPKLGQTAASIDSLKYTAVQFGPLFALMWNEYSQAANFLQNRLEEAKPAAEQLGSALYSAAASFRQNEHDQSKKLEKIPEQFMGP